MPTKIEESRKRKRQEQGPEEKPAPRRSKPLQKSDLTPGRLRILEHLASARWELTSSIHKLCFTHPHLIQQTQRDLAWLRDHGLIRQFVAYPERGRASSYGWVLLKAGASLLEIADWDTHWLRIPTYEQLDRRAIHNQIVMQLEYSHVYISEFRKGISFELTSPQTYSKAHPMPKFTPQYNALSIIVRWREIMQNEYDTLISNRDSNAFAKYEARLRNIENGVRLRAIPEQSNDYVLINRDAARDSRGYEPQICGIILVPVLPYTSDRFVEERIEEYSALHKVYDYLHLAVVVPDKQQKCPAQDELNAAGWSIIQKNGVLAYITQSYKQDFQFFQKWQQQILDNERQKAEAAERQRQEKEASERRWEESQRRLDEQMRLAVLEAERKRQAEIARQQAEAAAKAQSEAEELARQQAEEETQRGWGIFRRRKE